MKVALISGLLALSSCNAFALNYSDYKSIDTDAVNGDSNKVLIRTAYLAGIADTMNTLSRAGKVPLSFGDWPKLCLPSNIPINVDLVKSAISTAIKDENVIEKQKSSKDEIPAATLAIIGLAKLFPCAP